MRNLIRADERSGDKVDVGLNSMSSLVSDYEDDRANYGFSTYELSQCFPIESVLLALNVTSITLFSLDVEGVWDEYIGLQLGVLVIGCSSLNC